MQIFYVKRRNGERVRYKTTHLALAQEKAARLKNDTGDEFLVLQLIWTTESEEMAGDGGGEAAE